MAWRRPGDKPLSEPMMVILYFSHMWYVLFPLSIYWWWTVYHLATKNISLSLSLPWTHIWVTRLQWVNVLCCQCGLLSLSFYQGSTQSVYREFVFFYLCFIIMLSSFIRDKFGYFYVSVCVEYISPLMPMHQNPLFVLMSLCVCVWLFIIKDIHNRLDPVRIILWCPATKMLIRACFTRARGRLSEMLFILV